MLNIQTGVTTFYVKGCEYNEDLKLLKSNDLRLLGKKKLNKSSKHLVLEMQQELFSISIMQKVL